MAVIELVDREGELRKAKPCNEDTVIRNIENKSELFSKEYRTMQNTKRHKNLLLLNFLNESKEKNTGLAATMDKLEELDLSASDSKTN